jgi:hypothetical protein
MGRSLEGYSAVATFNCIERIDWYYQEHPKDHSLEQVRGGEVFAGRAVRIKPSPNIS